MVPGHLAFSDSSIVLVDLRGVVWQLRSVGTAPSGLWLGTCTEVVREETSVGGPPMVGLNTLVGKRYKILAQIGKGGMSTMNFGQHVVSYANATYDTLNTAKVVKPFVNPTADGGLQWKHSPQDYFKTLVPDPDQLWNFKTIYQAPGKLSDGVAEASNAIRVGISDL